MAWDSCIIIDAIQRKEGRYSAIQPMVRKAENAGLFIIVSMASIAEVMYLREFAAAGMSQKDQNDLIEKWFDNKYLIKRNVDFGVGKEAASLRRRFKGLTPVDSIILATAIVNKADTLITYDANNEGGRVALLDLDGKLGNSDTRISLPEDYTRELEFDFGPSGNDGQNRN